MLQRQHSHTANVLYSPGGAERRSWDCYNPCDHKGELKGKVLSSALGGGGSTLKRSVQKWFHFLPHYHKGRMAALLCDSGFNKGADLSPQERECALSVRPAS